MLWSLDSTNAPSEAVWVIDTANLAISGTFVATVDIQYFNESGAWVSLDPTFTAATINTINLGAPTMIRPKLSAFTSGAAVVEIRPR